MVPVSDNVKESYDNDDENTSWRQSQKLEIDHNQSSFLQTTSDEEDGIQNSENVQGQVNSVPQNNQRTNNIKGVRKIKHKKKRNHSSKSRSSAQIEKVKAAARRELKGIRKKDEASDF